MTMPETTIRGFTEVRSEDIPEIGVDATLYRHDETGAEVLALASDETNKTFAVGFATYPEDDTGVAHILEHMVLAGSESYPVRDPFFEMVKSSPAGFLNALTYPDRTIYPFATENEQDFHNLMAVYLDAVFRPRLTRATFDQEGWHLELERQEGPLSYRGVVFNEMKGALSDPNRWLFRLATTGLFPDNLYRLESGGDPEAIPNLTYEQLREFHREHYAPSRARFVLYGNVAHDLALAKIGAYLESSPRLEPLPPPAVQMPFEEPETIDATYPAGRDGKAFATVSWALPEPGDAAEELALDVLAHALTGTPGAPLRRALLDSGLGEAFTGGLASYLRQPAFSAGLRGVSPDHVDDVIRLVLDTLENVVEQALSAGDVAAARNTVEFRLREMDVHGGQRGVALAGSALGHWIHGRDPLESLKFVAALEALDERMASDPRYLEGLLRDRLVENPHRVDLRLLPDPAMLDARDRRERERLDALFAEMDQDRRTEILAATDALKAHQQAEESPEAVATLPFLRRTDMSAAPRTVPAKEFEMAGVPVLRYDLDTRGIVYLDLGFDLRTLPANLLPYASLLGRALLETGTADRSVAELSQAIGRDTGGIAMDLLAAAGLGRPGPVRFFLRGRALGHKSEALTVLLEEILRAARITDLDRIAGLAREEKARRESALVPNGHAYALRRAASHGSDAAWAREQIEGIASLKFVESLLSRLESEPQTVAEELGRVRATLLSRRALVVGVTADDAAWTHARGPLERLLESIAPGTGSPAHWERSSSAGREGFAIAAQVNYVGASVPLRDGPLPCSWLAAARHLRAAHLLPKIRFQGGAYGAGDALDVTGGDLGFYTYRDPDPLASIGVIEDSIGALRHAAGSIEDDELEKVVVGALGKLDPYALPGALGYRHLCRWLAGVDEDEAAERRGELFATDRADFAALADAVEQGLPSMRLAVLGPKASLESANEARGGDWLEIDASL